jgi:hypothetical protein
MRQHKQSKNRLHIHPGHGEIRTEFRGNTGVARKQALRALGATAAAGWELLPRLVNLELCDVVLQSQVYSIYWQRVGARAEATKQIRSSSKDKHDSRFKTRKGQEATTRTQGKRRRLSIRHRETGDASLFVFYIVASRLKFSVFQSIIESRFAVNNRPLTTWSKNRCRNRVTCRVLQSVKKIVTWVTWKSGEHAHMGKVRRSRNTLPKYAVSVDMAPYSSELVLLFSYYQPVTVLTTAFLTASLFLK